MSWTRRHWLGAALAGGFAALAQLAGLGPAAAAKKLPPARRPQKTDPKQPYKTRWIGHY
jgi:hypothetical protein